MSTFCLREHIKVLFVTQNHVNVNKNKMRKFLEDFSEKWYFIGTIVGIFAGISIGWLMAVYVLT